MKVRKIIDGKVQWFGNSKNGHNPFIEIKDEDSYIEAYKCRIYNLLNIIKGELRDKTYGILGIFGKESKEEIDIEIQDALRKRLDLTINRFISSVKDRVYTCEFTVTTPKGILLSLTVNM